MYSFAIELTGNFRDIEQRLIGVLKNEGLEILAETGNQPTLNTGYWTEKKPHKLLSAFVSPLTKKAVDVKTQKGFLMPCIVAMHVVKDGVIRVAFQIPNMILNLVKREDIFELSNEVLSHLFRVRQLLRGTLIKRKHINPEEI